MSYTLMMDEPPTFDERLSHLKMLIDNAKHIAFFGGAGVSTESGVPDFRSKDGLYNQHDIKFDKYPPEYLLSHDCLYTKPKVFYEFYRQKFDCRNIQPNITHKKLAELETNSKRVSVITQNVDCLHQKAGSKEVYEIHGTMSRSYCTNCHHEFDINYIFDNTSAIPRCPYCRNVGMVRPDVTMYGENLPEAYEAAIAAIECSDLMIVAGTSLTVYPAATLTSYFSGDNLVIINRDPTPQDNYAQIVFHENMGDIFSQI